MRAVGHTSSNTTKPATCAMNATPPPGTMPSSTAARVNNSDTRAQLITGSYDPNDKTAITSSNTTTQGTSVQAISTASML